jgi:hypothetical protein
LRLLRKARRRLDTLARQASDSTVAHCCRW